MSRTGLSPHMDISCFLQLRQASSHWVILASVVSQTHIRLPRIRSLLTAALEAPGSPPSTRQSPPCPPSQITPLLETLPNRSQPRSPSVRHLPSGLGALKALAQGLPWLHPPALCTHSPRALVDSVMLRDGGNAVTAIPSIGCLRCQLVQ